MFNGPYEMEITWHDESGCFNCPHCGKPIKTGEKVVAFPNPDGSVWHSSCREEWENEEEEDA